MVKNKIDWSIGERLQYVPPNLKCRNTWVGYLFSNNKKIPINPHNGKLASSTDLTTWSDFQTAQAAVKKYNLSGIGIVLTDGLCCIDLDHAITDGNLSPLAANIVNTFRDSYVEISRSGQGVHVFALGSVPAAVKTREIEIYSEKRYIAMTFNAVCANEVKEKQTEITQLWRWLDTKRNRGRTDGARLPQVKECSLSASQIIDKASRAKGGDTFLALYHGNWKSLQIGDGSQSSADLSFANKLCFWCGGDAALMAEIFRASGLYRTERKMMMAVNRAIRDCAEVYSGKR